MKRKAHLCKWALLYLFDIIAAHIHTGNTTMNKNKLMVGLGVLASAVLVGCGGGGGSSAPASKGSEAFIGNGIYKNDADLLVMVVDSTRAENNLVFGDFDNGGVMFVDTATTTKDQMNTKGLTVAAMNVSTHDAKHTMALSFADKKVTLATTVDGAPLVYSMEKTSASLPLNQIVGTHNSPDGSTWTINADGSFVINSTCTISGNLKRRGDYFNIDKATAVSCNDAGYNGDYNGMLMTISHQGKDYIAGVLGNDTSVLFGDAVKS